MAKSYFAPTLKEGYILNSYNVHKFDEDNILVTVENGAWVLLNAEEYDLLRLHKLEEDPVLLAQLKEKNIVITTDSVHKTLSAYKKRFSFLFQGTSLHIIVPTLRCNQRCLYCHSRAEPDSGAGFDMDRDTAKAAVDFMFKTPSPVLTIEFQGGECLLNFELVEFIIDYARQKEAETKKRVKFALVTNLTKMDESIIKSLKTRKVIGLSTSLDGPKELHDDNRKYLDGTGSYDEVVHWIRRIKEEWTHDFNLSALCTLTRHSLDCGPEIVKEYKNLGFHDIWLRPLNNIGFAAQAWDKIGYSAQEYVDFYKKTLDVIVKNNTESYVLRELMTTILLRRILLEEDARFTDIQSPCGAAIGQLLYDYKGDIFTCDEAKLFEEFKLGNVFTSSFSDLFKNESLKAMMDISSKKNYICDNCVWNPYCGICPIYTFKAQGTIVSKLAMDARCKMMSGLISHIFQKLLFSERYKSLFFKWLKRSKHG